MEVDSKLGMSLDDLIKKQRSEKKPKSSVKAKPAAKGPQQRGASVKPQQPGKKGAAPQGVGLAKPGVRGGAGVTKKGKRGAKVGTRLPQAPIVALGGRPGQPAKRKGADSAGAASARRVVVSLANNAKAGGRTASGRGGYPRGPATTAVSAAYAPFGAPPLQTPKAPLGHVRRNAHGILLPA